MLIQEHLQALLEAELAAGHPVDLTFDLNPHLQLRWAADEVVKRVAADGEGVTCTREDVYEFWLVHSLGANVVGGLPPPQVREV